MKVFFFFVVKQRSVQGGFAHIPYYGCIYRTGKVAGTWLMLQEAFYGACADSGTCARGVVTLHAAELASTALTHRSYSQVTSRKECFLEVSTLGLEALPLFSFYHI